MKLYVSVCDGGRGCGRVGGWVYLSVCVYVCLCECVSECVLNLTVVVTPLSWSLLGDTLRVEDF